jgi:membrane protease YdiL (CAAX protease family)
MSHVSAVMMRIQGELTMEDKRKTKWHFAEKHPVISFLFINFAWTWAFWLGVIPFKIQGDLLLTVMVMIGGFGPAIGAVLTLALREGCRFDLSRKKFAALGLGALVILFVLVGRYLVGNVPQYDILSDDLTISAPIITGVLFVSLVGGWILSSAVSKQEAVWKRMRSLFPWRNVSGWFVFGILFYPVMILASWGLSLVFDLGVEIPALWGQPVGQVLPIYAVSFLLTFFVQGGFEEPGWRGLMQPELQKRCSPLVSALIVSVFWSLWHLPLYLNGFYAADLVGGMLGGFIFRILLSIFLAWMFNRSNSLFLMVYLHTCFNLFINFLPVSDAGLSLLWLLVVVFVVIKDKMYRRIAPECTGSGI